MILSYNKKSNEKIESKDLCNISSVSSINDSKKR